jgi:hypothetical protein
MINASGSNKTIVEQDGFGKMDKVFSNNITSTIQKQPLPCLELM